MLWVTQGFKKRARYCFGALMISIARCVCCLLCCVMLMGCVGGFVVAEGVDDIYDAPVELGKRGFATMNQAATVITRQELLKKWGEPYRTEVQGETERLFYKREIGFSGLLAFVLIPIPLVVPVSRPTIVELRNDTLVRVLTMYGDFVAGGVCGIVVWNDGMGPGCLRE